MIRRFLAVLAVVGLPAGAAAQDGDDGGGFLSNLIERNLSSPGRDVQVRGFEGALSSRATIDEITIADRDGIWLTLRDAALDWNRGALVRGRLEVNELSAGEIIVARTPLPEEGIDPPPAAAPGFSLPDLPVSVRVDSLRAERLELGAPLLGQAVEMTLDASASLAGGAGEASLSVTRTDGKRAEIALQAGFDNESRVLSLDLSAAEGPEGIVAGLTGLPGAPALALDLAGTGPLSDYTAELALATDGQDRLSGRVTLGTEGDDQTFAAVLAGDLRPLMTAEYGAFFGAETALEMAGRQTAAGRVEIGTLVLRAAELSLGGAVQIAADGLPDLIDLQGRIGGGAAPVLLPVAGDPTRVDAVTFDLALGARGAGPGDWTLTARVDGLDRPDLAIGTLDLSGDGTVTRDPRRVTAALDFAATGLAPADPALAQALGAEIGGRADVDWRDGAPVAVSSLTLDGADYGLSVADLTLDGLDSALEIVVGAVEGRLDDLSRFSALAGQELGGAARIDGSARYAPLSGVGAVDLRIDGQHLAVGIPEADNLLAGASRVALSAERDESGTTLRALDVAAGSLTLDAAGTLGPGVTDISGDLEFADLGVLGDGYGGRLTGRVALRDTGDGAQAIGFDARGQDVAVGVAEADALLAGESRIALEATRAGALLRIDAFELRAATLSAKAAGTVGTGQSDLTATLDFADLGVMGPPYGGRLTAEARLTEEGDGQRLRATAEGNGLSVGVAEVDSLLAGRSTIALNALRRGEIIEIVRASVEAATLALSAAGTVDPGASDLTADLAFSDLSALGGPYGGSLTAQARVTEDGAAQRVRATAEGDGLSVGIAEVDNLLAGTSTIDLDATLRGEIVDIARASVEAASLSLIATGTVDPGASDLTADLTFTDLSALGGPYGGSLDLMARVTEEGAVREFGLRGTAETVRTGIAEADRVLRGTTELTLIGTEENGRLRVERLDLSNPQLTATANAESDGGTRRVALDARLADLALLVPGFPGALSVDGTVTEADGQLTLDIDGAGPGGIDAGVSGTVAGDFSTADLGIRGTLQTALANPFIAPRAVEGAARFDLRLAGPPGLGALAGRVEIPQARVADPASGLGLENLRLGLDLAGGRATVDLSAEGANGGQIAVTGPVSLSAPYTADLRAVLTQLILTDPELYEATVWGDLAISGPLTGGGRITGQVELGDTEIRVPSTGFGASGTLVDVRHVNEPAEVRATRARAGLLDTDGNGVGGNGGPGFGLDVRLLAPDRIFVRGRGLDAQLGGELRATGTTNDIVAVGAFDLVRGRLDILGQRFTLDEGSARLQGGLIPFLRLVATTRTDAILASIVVEGPADAPEIRFESQPELPEEEVLAQILFGRDLTSISAFQALQLASAVATLTGRGGEGVIGRLREGFDLDDLDVASDGEGGTAVRAGKQISDNIYTDVTVDSTGRSEINLNIDVTPSITARGRVGSDGSTGLGLYFERDY